MTFARALARGLSPAKFTVYSFVYSVGLGAGRFDYATAVGLFQTVVGVIMVLSVNAIIKKMGE